MSLKIENITFGYTKEKILLNDISFEIAQGKIGCVLGVSGTGKSTLLRVISNGLPSDKTQAFNGNVSFSNDSITKLIDIGKLSFMFQESTLMDFLTVENNVKLPLRILNQSFSSVDEIITLVGLNDAKNKYPNSLSGGMKTRTALARSFVSKPNLLLMDEPFAALDVGWKQLLFNELKSLVEEYKTTVLLVTHSLEEAIELGDLIIVLGHNGNVIFNSNGKEVDAEYLKKLIIEDLKTIIS
jgi:ABC-type nitrate/sulfonate/bicarbonate transport system ATPase subunit